MNNFERTMEHFHQSHFLLLLLGLVGSLTILIKSFFSRISISPIPVYILIGVVTRYLTDRWNLGADSNLTVIQIFGDIGLIMILFQVGVESNLKSLIRQIQNAVYILILEVIMSALAVFFTLHFLVGISFAVSVLVSIAFVATSIAVSISVWKEAGVLGKNTGQLLLDLSAMDDVAGITLMVITTSFIVSFSNGYENFFQLAFFVPVLVTIVKLAIIIVLCYAFSIYLEPKFSQFIKHYEIVPDPTVTIICLVLVFSAVVGYLGLTIALGSFLIGLSFSRDPTAVKILSSYQSLESFFIPFFFFSVGYSVTNIVDLSLWPVFVIFSAAVLGKLVGVALPSWILKLSIQESLLLGLSMIPRAEITLVVLRYAKATVALPQDIYSACVIVVLATCFIPILLKPLLVLEET